MKMIDLESYLLIIMAIIFYLNNVYLLTLAFWTIVFDLKIENFWPEKPNFWQKIDFFYVKKSAPLIMC